VYSLAGSQRHPDFEYSPLKSKRPLSDTAVLKKSVQKMVKAILNLTELRRWMQPTRCGFHLHANFVKVVPV